MFLPKRLYHASILPFDGKYAPTEDVKMASSHQYFMIQKKHFMIQKKITQLVATHAHMHLRETRVTFSTFIRVDTSRV